MTRDEILTELRSIDDEITRTADDNASQRKHAGLALHERLHKLLNPQMGTVRDDPELRNEGLRITRRLLREVFEIDPDTVAPPEED
jgi:hypothetical protein